MPTTDLVTMPVKTLAETSTTQIWPEPLDTPGIVPRHLTRSAAASSPLLEIFQRLLYRLRPTGTGDLEKALALLAIYKAIRPIYGHLRDLCLWAFTVNITIPENDPVAKEVLAWMGAEVVKKRRTHSAMLVTGGLDANSLGHAPMRRYQGGVPQVEAQEQQDVMYVPPIGTGLFWIGFRPFLFYRSGGQSYARKANALVSGNLVDNQGRLQNALTLTTLGWKLDPLHKFIEFCHEHKRKHLNGTTTVYYAGGSRHDPYSDGWSSVSKAVRKLDTIDMDEDVKSDIIRDAEYYYSAQSRQFFADCGIPYRRGYLFHGPPGTGKSSFSAALAGHLQCDIYHINLASGSMNDGSLHSLFLNLPRKCVVVIEDIDSAGIGREQAPSKKSAVSSTRPELAALLAKAGIPAPPSLADPTSDSSGRPRNAVTLSGLLNAIDGNASQEGRLLIMTSNNPDALDKALVRPGRVDRKVYFGNMTKSAGKSIFKRLVGRSAIAHDAAFTMQQIEQYADQFADKVPANTFTPADIQNYLQGCRGDPVKALSDIDAWIVEHRGGGKAEKARGGEEHSYASRSEETDSSEGALL